MSDQGRSGRVRRPATVIAAGTIAVLFGGAMFFVFFLLFSLSSRLEAGEFLFCLVGLILSCAVFVGGIGAFMGKLSRVLTISSGVSILPILYLTLLSNGSEDGVAPIVYYGLAMILAPVLIVILMSRPSARDWIWQRGG